MILLLQPPKMKILPTMLITVRHLHSHHHENLTSLGPFSNQPKSWTSWMRAHPQRSFGLAWVESIISLHLRWKKRVLGNYCLLHLTVSTLIQVCRSRKVVLNLMYSSPQILFIFTTVGKFFETLLEDKGSTSKAPKSIAEKLSS